MLLWSLLLTTSAQAQQDGSLGTLFKERGAGGYGGWQLGLAFVGGRPGFRMSARGGWLLESHFAVGAFVETLRSDSSASQPVELVDGGFAVEAFVAPRKPIHVAIEGGIGAGWLTWEETSAPAVAPFVAARLDINVVSWMRASLGPNLRVIRSAAVPDDTGRFTTGLDVGLAFGKLVRQ